MRPDRILADKAYSSRAYRGDMHDRKIAATIKVELDQLGAFPDRRVDHLEHSGAGNAYRMHEIRGGTDDAVPSQRSARSGAAQEAAPAPVTAVMPVRLFDNARRARICGRVGPADFLEVARIVGPLLAE
jgi:hypothetical protein